MVGALQLQDVLGVLMALACLCWTLQSCARQDGTDTLDLGSSLEVALKVTIVTIKNTRNVGIKNFELNWSSISG